MADETEPTAEGAADAAPKSKMPLIIAIVVGLAVGGGSGAAVIGPMVAKKMVAVPTVPDTNAAAAGAAEHGGEAAKGGEHGEGGKAGSDALAMIPLENLVLNPQGSNGSRYLLMSLTIEPADKKGFDALTARDAELRDLILTTLSVKTVEELSDIGRRDEIKKQLADAIAQHFGKGSVKQLFFPQFVIQ